MNSRLDYCNSLLYGVSDELLQKLQVIQNAAARVVTGAKKVDHITPVLHELHWLPVRQRIMQVYVSDDRVQMPECVGASLSGRRLRAGLICGQQTAPEIC